MRSAMRRAPSSGRARSAHSLLAIRAAGTEAGWAFQLQDPRTILVLLLLTTAITLNLLRVFEVPAVTLSALPSDSFGTGALAAFVATPCAGPFLGAALGPALLLPPDRSRSSLRSAWACLAVPADRLRPRPCGAAAEARAVDGAAAAHPRHSHGADGRGLPLAVWRSAARWACRSGWYVRSGCSCCSAAGARSAAGCRADMWRRLPPSRSASWRLGPSGTAAVTSRRCRRGGLERGAVRRPARAGGRCSSISPPTGA